MSPSIFEATAQRIIKVTTLTGEKGSTDFIRIVIPGTQGKTLGGHYPTLGVVGRLGGLGARPERIGFTSDGDGALAALAVAAHRGRRLVGLTAKALPCKLLVLFLLVFFHDLV